jgi:apolipoprotein D and lipocalin family protein
MFKRLLLSLALAAIALAGPVAAAPEPTHRVDIARMMGRWYEVARIPNKLQNGCTAGTSDWARNASGFSVVQACRKGANLAQWKGQARVSDPATNAKLRMSFFGGLVSQEYWVLDHRPDQGWLILATANGKYLWLMSQKPSLPAAIRDQALARIRQLGFDVARLEFPGGPRG